MKKIIFCLLIVLLGSTGCNEDEFFELTNPPEFPWLNMEELERGVVTPYNIAFSSSWGNFMGDDRLIFDAMSDALQLLPNTSADIPFEEMYLRTVDVRIQKANAGYGNGYKCITHANSVLDFLAENDYQPYGEPSANDAVNIERIRGEMHFMRAYAYFALVRRHGPTVGASNFNSELLFALRLTTPLSADAANSAEYVSAARIYAQIIEDLTAAKRFLPEAYESGVHPPAYSIGRATRYAAAAMLARVHFQLGDVSSALPELDYVINGPFNLNADPEDAFTRDDASQGDEVIWQSIHFDPVTITVNKIPTSMNYSDYRVTNGGRGDFHRRCTWNQFPMSHAVLQQVGWMDSNLGTTEEALTDKRYLQLFWRLEGNRGNNNDDPRFYEMQYAHIKDPMIWGDKYYRGIDGQRTNVPLIRLAEMLLTRSILRFNQGNEVGALVDLNLVRVRAGLEPLTSITADDIHNERIKEMAFEGDRIFYLQALQLPIPPGDRIGEALITYPYEGFYWQIPQSELDFRDAN